MTVAQLSATMTQREMVEWLAWFSIEPRGDERADWQTGWLAWMLALIHSNAKGRKKMQWPDFVPFRRRPEEPDVSAKVKAVFGKLRKRDQPHQP